MEKIYLANYQHVITLFVGLVTLFWMYRQMKIMEKQRQDVFYNKQLNFISLFIHNKITGLEKCKRVEVINKNISQAFNFILKWTKEKDFLEFQLLNPKASLLFTRIFFYSQYILDQYEIISKCEKNSPYKRMLQNKLIESYNTLRYVSIKLDKLILRKVFNDDKNIIEKIYSKIKEFIFYFCKFLPAKYKIDHLMHLINKEKLNNKTNMLFINNIINIVNKKENPKNKENGKVIDAKYIDKTSDKSN